MTSLIGASEAARRLGVTTATLYSYVSRGRISRRTAADGRSSLFSVADVDALAGRSRRGPTGPRPTIDVRISSSITDLRDDGLSVRGFELPDLVRHHSFETIADLLITGALAPASWPRPDRLSDRLVDIAHAPVTRLAIAAHSLGDTFPGDDAASAARRLIQAAPTVLGARRATGSTAQRLTSVWRRRPTPQLIDAVDTALGLLADHELATSTLAVRVAASVRASPMESFAAGLAVVSGPLHGMASVEAHRFLEECSLSGVAQTVAAFQTAGKSIPGFGHKVYRGPDPRFAVLLDAVGEVGDISLVEEVLAEAGRVLPKHPNIDLALGALTHVAGVDSRVPIFAVARIAGWAAHYAEELDEPPVRFRGVTA